MIDRLAYTEVPFKKGRAMALSIPIDQFESRTGIVRSDYDASESRPKLVIAFRDLVRVESVQAMPMIYLKKLLNRVTLGGVVEERPYAECEVQFERVDTANALVAQTFVQNEKLLRILRNVSMVLDGHCVSHGFAKLTSLIIRGANAEGVPCIAHYLPSIMEKHDGQYCLLDGTHRGYLAQAIGTTIEAIVLSRRLPPFPARPQPWSAVQSVDLKPPPPERHFDLRPELFRDLKFVGIDG
ncbi:MAG: hypothetical protein WCJ29_02705 [bacterium]